MKKSFQEVRKLTQHTDEFHRIIGLSVLDQVSCLLVGDVRDWENAISKTSPLVGYPERFYRSGESQHSGESRNPEI